MLGVVVSACQADANQSERQEFEPITVKQAPEPKEGTGTVPACEGVRERGECDGHVAVYCDLEREDIRRVDCEALGKTCLADVGRGAVCDGSTSDTYDVQGVCEEGAAVWKDADSDEVQRWNCEEDGLTCQVDACQDGAYCCPPGGGNADDPTGPDACGGLDYDGVCEAGIARWCGDDEVQTFDCTAAGLQCEVDTCAQGAFCCGESTDECETLGQAGECTSDGKVRYCNDGEITEYACTGGKTCQVGACYGGAECCDEEQTSADECEQLGVIGECDGQTARWCNGTDIVERDCVAEGKTCQVDACVQGAYCCEGTLTCEDVGGTVGSCAGNTLRYCNAQGAVVQTNCTDLSKTCAVDDCRPGEAECC